MIEREMNYNEIHNNGNKHKPESFPIHWTIARFESDSLSHLHRLDHEETDTPELVHHYRFHKDRAFHNPQRTSATLVIHSTISRLLRHCGI
jgi:hypothetical protein